MVWSNKLAKMINNIYRAFGHARRYILSVIYSFFKISGTSWRSQVTWAVAPARSSSMSIVRASAPEKRFEVARDKHCNGHGATPHTWSVIGIKASRGPSTTNLLCPRVEIEVEGVSPMDVDPISAVMLSVPTELTELVSSPPSDDAISDSTWHCKFQIFRTWCTRVPSERGAPEYRQAIKDRMK